MARLIALILGLVAAVSGGIIGLIGALAAPPHADAWVLSGSFLIMLAIAARVFADMSEHFS